MTEKSAIIIGAGPAGLAVGACLTRARISSTILERDRAVGASWRGHYDRLHLHTNKGTSALPFIPFPRDYPRYPSR
ncbi:MAG TPA: NAD(P)-binding domain-containing protein, partial [Gemmatimonadaceae bacterium]|nr:NAD(P)-binding domain-containing protein [Gemmatimonadaceae bacterium]